MRSCAVEGGTVWLSWSSSVKRKLSWTWEIAEVGGTRVYVNPARANELVAEAIEAGRIRELAGYTELQREVVVGASRIDFLLRGAGPDCYVEVKCATMAAASGGAAFPDAVTQRGTRHLLELAAVRARGARAVLLFCVARHGACSVEPAAHVDQVYTETLRAVARQGVEVVGYRCDVLPEGVSLLHPVPVLL